MNARTLVERRHALASGVAALLLDGLPYRRIASALGVSPTLVGRVVQRLYETFGVWRRSHLVAVLQRVAIVPGVLAETFNEPKELPR